MQWFGECNGPDACADEQEWLKVSLGEGATPVTLA